MSLKAGCRKTEQVKEKRSLKSVLVWAGIYVLIFALALLVCLFVMQAINNLYRYYPVKGMSMQPTINKDITSQEGQQDGVFIKVTTDVELNDVIIIKDKTKVETEKDPTIIKRVIALGGDKVTIFKIGNLYQVAVIRKDSDEIQLLEENYLSEQNKIDWGLKSSRYDTNNGTNSSIRYEGEFYNTYFSNSSENIVKVDYQGQKMLFYQIPENQVFFLGDNRPNSSDARDAKRGLAKKEEIVGKVVEYVYDAQKQKNEGKLWFTQMGLLISYLWSDLVEYFAW